MKNGGVFTVACICGLILCGGARAENSFNQRLAEARETLNAGEFDRAYEMYSALLREQPGNASVNSGLGQASFETGRLSHAALAYERALAANPGNDRARLELGRTFFAMEQYDLAAQYFKEVLDRQPPPLVRQNIEQFMAHIKSRTKRWDFWGRVDVGAFYDDNINYGPDSDLIETPLGLLQLDPGTAPHDAFGLFTMLSMSGFYDIGAPGGFSLYGDGSFYGTLLDNVHSEELILYRTGLGLQHTTRRSLIQIPFQYQNLQRGHAHYMNVYGIRPSALYSFSANWLGVSRAMVERRDYAKLSARDSWYYALECMGKRYFGPMRHSLDFIVQGFYENARENVYGNKGFELSTTGEYRLPWRTMIYLRARYRNAFYDARELLAPVDRYDRQWQMLAGLNKVITGNWGMDASYQWTRNNSSFDLYDYSRNVVTLSTFLTF